jgi:hypothetical protein
MSYRPQTTTRRGTGRGREKARHDKAKRKEHKHRSGGKYILEEEPTPTVETVVEKTVGRLQSLGSQTFALSPFSQYYDDWLVTLKSVLSELEANPETKIDSIFSGERGKIVTSIEQQLAKRRREESDHEEVVKKLAEKNHSLVQIDTDYAAATRKLSSEKNSQIQDLTRKLHDLEEEIEEINQTKTSIFNPFSKKAKTQKTIEITKKIEVAKRNLQSGMHNFEIDQEKFHDEYEKKKESVINEVRKLEKEAESLEIDNSSEDRKVACEALVSAVKDLMQRNES